jgi:hypothetical protein
MLRRGEIGGWADSRLPRVKRYAFG